MCGIVGIVGDGVVRADAVKMLATIEHRGPDGSGIFASEHVALGNVRLAIVDPSPAGAQPMRTPDGRFTLVYNGELYNHLELRKGLAHRGISFRGHSDTETLLWLLVEHGAGILPKLNGIFGFAFHDAVTGTTLVARDQVGVKPIYFAKGRSNRVLFASEIKALFATGEVERRMNTADLPELFMFHFIAGERTAFSTVTELLPGHYMVVANDGRVVRHEYWSPRRALHAERETHELGQRVESAVCRQLMADVPLAVMSSGGVDSGIVSAYAAQHAQLAGFTFSDTAHGYAEVDAARELGARYGISIEEVRIDEHELTTLLPKLTWHYDEPLPRPHHVAAYAVSRQARARGFKVLMSGEGGDELFGGYQRYADLAPAIDAGDEAALVYAHNRVAIPRISRFLRSVEFENRFRTESAESTRGLDAVNRELVYDQRTFLQHFLQRSDRMGLAAGVEIRVPLLDVELVEFTNAQPGSRKVAGTRTKIGLRAVASGLLGNEFVNRPKLGFDMPMLDLLKTGPVAEMLDDLLLQNPRLAAVCDLEGVRSLVRELRAGGDDVWKVVWLLLTTEIWMRELDVVVA